MKNSSRFYHFCFLCFCGFFVLILLGLLLMQTQAFQDKLISKVEAEARKNNVTLKIDTLEGLAPFKWSCEKITLSWEDGKELILKKVNLRIAFFPLFKKQLSISFLRAREILFSFPSLEETKVPFPKLQLPNLPFNLAAKTVQVQDLTLKDVTKKTEIHLSLMGKAKVNKNLKEVQFDLIVIEPILHNNFHIQLLSSEKKEIINGKVHLSLKDTQNLSSFLGIPLNASLESLIRCWGNWSYWQDLQQKKKTSPLSFTIKSEIDSFSTPGFPFLNRKWSLDTQVSLWPDLSSCCENFRIESNWLRMLGKGCLSPEFQPVEVSAILTVEELKDLSSLLSIPLAGKIEAKTGLKNNTFLLSLSSPSLKIGKSAFSPADFKIQASLQHPGWSGHVSCALQDPLLPWNGTSEFVLNNKKLQVHDVSLQAKDLKISGSGEIDCQTYASEGSFFLWIPELRSFRTVFPTSDLEGKIGGSIAFSYQEKDLSLQANLIAKNVRYQSSLLSNGTLEVNAQNLFQEPSGLFSLECENLLTKKGEISKLCFYSNATSENRQTYTLEAWGDWKQRFSFFSAGFWKKDNAHLSIESQTCEGNIFNQFFQAKPFQVKKDADQISLQNYSLELGGGTLDAEVHLGKGFANFHTKASHIPLDLFTIFYPNIALYGKASFQGSFLGNEKNSIGYLLATLEEGTLPHLQAKGSMQVHLNPKSAQIHTHFYATDLQFLDWTATLPLRYSYYPFKICLDETGFLASEWTSQGNIEAIFNFLQMPNQKTSGLITSHFLLSGTAQTPYLHGEMDIQNGLYENYFIGTRLRNINASFVASGSSLDLHQFSAADKDGGTVTASGNLQLDKKEGFPFSVECDLSTFNLIQSNLFKTKTTGDLLFEGNVKGCKATGELQIDSATFTLSDKLPQDIPTLPVEYINKPIHLQHSEILPSAEYPVSLDLHLTSDDTVFIKGRGLDSEWQGNIILKGTPTKLIGNGSLTLKKGEFSFSGKAFTLTHGDITFSDNPEHEANLTLVGELRLPTALVIANLQGPLTSPRLTFQSIPGLPTSSILSLILFNKDISEITPLQALQLAQVVMSLSGDGGPDVLGTIRKTIGVDKLSISGKEGSDEIALQIGWCIAHGVTVSLSQSATSSDITIEVDLKNGFLFQAETQNQEEGKFSLKWNHNY